MFGMFAGCFALGGPLRDERACEHRRQSHHPQHRDKWACSLRQLRENVVSWMFQRCRLFLHGWTRR